MGSPTRREVSSQPASREDQAGPRRVAERSAVVMKRVMIVERRDLSSRVRPEGARARAIGDEPKWVCKINVALLSGTTAPRAIFS